MFMSKFVIKLVILLFGVSAFLFMGCKKDASVDSPTTTGEVSHANPASEKAVRIRATFTADNFPNVSGTFTTWGALGDNVSGTATMDIGGLTPIGMVAHCVVVITFYNADHSVKGTITIKQQCEFSVNPVYPNAKGQWQIVGGTGAYSGIKGNGITTMPPPFDEDMTGVIL